MTFAPGQVRHQRRTALMCAPLVASLALVDGASGAGAGTLATILVARGIWVLSLLGGAALLRGANPRPTASAALMSGTSAAAVIVIVAETGGSGSGYFSFLLAMPLCLQVLLPGQLAAATVSGVAGIVAGAAMLTRAGTPAPDLLRWIFTAAATAAIAAWASRLNGALFAAELEAARARADAAAALAASERRRAETERLAIVGRLAAGVAHEINNPLAFVKSNLSFVSGALAARGPPGRDGEEARDAVGEALLGVDRIRRIVADLGRFARDGGDEPCATDVRGAVEEALRLASVRTREIAVRVSVPAELPPVRMCRHRLVQVLVNIAVNAADAVEAAGGGAARRWIAVEARPEADGVTIRVEDGGDGIDAQAAARLFEPFFTTKPPGVGVGLGLALSHEYVAAAGGRLTAGNGRGGGACFEIGLPAHRGAPAPCPACSDERRARSHAA